MIYIQFRVRIFKPLTVIASYVFIDLLFNNLGLILGDQQNGNERDC